MNGFDGTQAISTVEMATPRAPEISWLFLLTFLSPAASVATPMPSANKWLILKRANQLSVPPFVGTHIPTYPIWEIRPVPYLPSSEMSFLSLIISRRTMRLSAAMT
ncbi:hypothetical protein BGZ61DRAFT_459146 [Ilyonectria robusta]|uniref:uncharacterized protein n=1 Tax=Ilyonectria robusta TaxID=1079257 RepID=UPI001E8EC38A|nr:uncharacterized protein BGZ61DRAFT_459146 [Ilyonectria robusta]KAH8672309.1 hypothetical protein BGZ61DRAFT_459146 [Ilyonectria robusta]